MKQTNDQGDTTRNSTDTYKSARVQCLLEALSHYDVSGDNIIMGIIKILISKHGDK